MSETNINSFSKDPVVEFDFVKTVGSYKLVRNLTEQDIENLVVDCIETGITSWGGVLIHGEDWDRKPKGVAFSSWAARLLLDGKPVTFYDKEDPEESSWELTLEKLLKGIQMNADERSFDSDLEQADAITFDCIIQYALFEKIEYS